MIQGAAASIPTEQQRFVACYEPVVRAYLATRWRLPLQHERISDATQEVFLRCLQRDGVLSRVDPTRPSGFRSFLRGIVSNVAAELERDLGRQATSGVEGTDLEAQTTSPSAAFDRAWAEMIVAEAWVMVEEQLRRKKDSVVRLRVLSLRYKEGVTPRQIVTELELPDIAEVRKVLATVRYQFRVALLSATARHHPNIPTELLEQKCQELIDAIRFPE